MKKKFLTSILASALALSSLISVAPVNAAATDEVGGLDFYSITFHYENEILLECDEKDFNNKAKQELVDKLVIKAGAFDGGNFYQIQADGGIESDCYYSRLPKKNTFITHITNGSAISSNEKISLFGYNNPYDAEPYKNQNPNIQYAEDGYALAKELDKDGNNLKIDQNGFIVYSDNVWRTAEGKRVEPFIQIPVVKKTGAVNKKGVPETEVVLSNEYEWISFEERFDENGKIVNTKNLGYMYMLTKEEFEAFLADESQTELKLYRAPDEETAEKAYRKSKNESYAVLCLVNSDPKNEADFATDKVFKNEDIVRDANGYVTFASPKMGTPLSTVKIVDVTVEIDALGAQLYDDLAQDPQQKNIIKVSLNDCGYNAEQYKKWYDEGLYTDEKYAELEVAILGSAKSQTTRTSIETNKSKYNDDLTSPTTKSISLELNQDVLNSIPSSAQIYLDFTIGENQPAEAYNDDYKKKMVSDSLDSDIVYYLTEDDKPEAPASDATNKDSSSDYTTIIIIAAAAAVVVIAAVVIIVVVTKKKKPADDVNTDANTDDNNTNEDNQ